MKAVLEFIGALIALPFLLFALFVILFVLFGVPAIFIYAGICAF